MQKKTELTLIQYFEMEDKVRQLGIGNQFDK